jgi:hypothetical protein
MSITLLLAVLEMGCGVPGKMTGGGFMPSSDGVEGHKAVFGFNGQQCDMTKSATGHLEYHDPYAARFGSAGVKLSADVASTLRCVDSAPLSYPVAECRYCGRDAYVIRFSYSSSMPGLNGSGQGWMCAWDRGEGSNAADDFALINLSDGPFAGYGNIGPTQGNLQSHECK